MLIDCAVVGAGPAGLATSAALSARGVEHVVLERGRVGESWRTQRWESFRLNTPGWMNQLLGEQARESYATGVEVVQRLEKLAANCPVREGVPVARLAPAGDRFVLQAGGGDLLARTVVVATGDQNLPKVPALAGTFPDRVAQYHTGDYRGPDQLPDGAVLVVGSAQSGCQIAEDLRAGGRRVVLATSPVGRVPFRHRGRETIEWLAEAGFMDQRPRDLPDPSVMRAAMPIIAPGRGLSLPALARAGVTLAGRLVAVEGERVTFVDSVVWCTGFTGDFSWLDPALVELDGQPRHADGAGPVPGLWYLGLRWLVRRCSSLLFGFPDDAATIANAVRAHLDIGQGPVWTSD